MIDRVVSGGQTGADQAGLRAARAAGIATGGWAPLGWETEDGPAPWLAGFGLVECPEAGYPPRTLANARDSDATLWFGDPSSPGGRLTLSACRRLGKPSVRVVEGVSTPSRIASWLAETPHIKVLNVAGSRESRAPGIGARVERFLGAVFRQLAGG